MTHKSVNETINVPKGVDNGVNVRVSKKGHVGLGAQPGDLMIQVKVKPHSYFKRDGSDIHTDLYLSIPDVSSLLILTLSPGRSRFRSAS